MLKKKWIELVKAHRHAGREYKPGQKINLAEDKADWLISKKVAVEAKADASEPAEKAATMKKE